MTRYVVYRHGANAANQHMRLKMPVALVDAESAEQACETRACCPGTLYATSELVRAPGIHAYHNQYFTAKAASRAGGAVAKLERERIERGES